MPNLIRLPAKPSPVTVDLTRSCLIVVDMQKAFLSYGGMFDILGFDISRLRRIIEPVKRVLASWREAGLKIIYVRHVYSQDLSDAGGPESRDNR
ncbi:MAG: cysteine hydrolase family protein [Candidatus Nezhaarchaeales archaeon]